ncbi:MAG: hypothetical protein V5B34_11560 [Accumulibacter sp.]|jgi:hypothetical protein
MAESFLGPTPTLLGIEVNHRNSDNISTYDPYDLWALDVGITVREKYYAGETVGRMGAVALGLLDWLVPLVSRRILDCPRRLHPITAGLLCLAESKYGEICDREEFESFWIHTFSELATQAGNPSGAWGLGFRWMSKNGLYGPEIPFITHTPYVMEALSNIRDSRAADMLDGTWNFLNSLIVMAESESELALSYAPVREPRIVVNANSYAAFAYALQASREYQQQQSLDRTFKLVSWLLQRQNDDGLWWYYADNEPGNFIDCFHTCFVVKNLVKVCALIPELESVCRPAIDLGWSAIRSSFMDHQRGLCKRFAIRDFKDPFVWDLYDQAEYLGLLIDFDCLEEAASFATRVCNAFVRGSTPHARIDVFGRKWGANFLRWGIAPFHYQSVRLRSAIKSRIQSNSGNISVLSF